MRVVLDTNVAVSALLFGGVPQQLLDLARTGESTLQTSKPLLDELAGVLNRSKFARRFSKNRPVTPRFLLRRYTLLTTSVTLGPIERVVPTDTDDDVVIATAIAAEAGLIVSGVRICSCCIRFVECRFSRRPRRFSSSLTIACNDKLKHDNSLQITIPVLTRVSTELSG